MKKGKPAEAMKMSSLTVRDATYTEFQNRVGKKNVSKAIQNLMDQYLDAEHIAVGPDPVEEAALSDILATNVAEFLRRNPEWATEVVRKSHLRWPSGMILRDRMTRHYTMDKQYLATHFANWLSQRIRYHFDEGSDVTLFLDAGSAVLWLSLHLWPLLAEISKVATWRRPGPRRLLLITNNLPLAEGYADQCELKHFSNESPTSITCELLGGVVRSRYAALTGATGEDRLKQLVPNEETLHGPRHIAILAGNYIRLFSDTEQPVAPTPLIRGTGQQELKELYVRCAHETYILGSIGKFFRGPTKSINTALNLDSAPRDERYKDVEVSSDHLNRVKVVTSIRRDRKAILKSHSDQVLGLLGGPDDPVKMPATLDIRAMRHFCYRYDDPIAGKSPEEQLPIEFPHPGTRTPQFLGFYDVVGQL